jgi:O-antigen/teichoic acid export membrane protein
LIKNIIANFAGKFWSLFSVFLFVPLYIDFLGFESYSVISFTLVLAGLIAILDAGLTATLSREFARADKTREEKQNILGTLESVYFLLISVAVTILFIFSHVIAAQWLNVAGFSTEELSLFLKLVSFEVGFQMLFRFYLGGLFGLEFQVAANVLQVGWGMVRNGLVVLLIYFLPTLQVFFIWQAASTILFTIILKFVLQKRLAGQGAFNFCFTINKLVLKEVWRFAGGMMLISIVAAVNTQLDKLTISKMLSIESLGYYTLAVSLSTGLVAIVSPISVALLPRFTALYSEKKNDDAAKLFLMVNLLTSVIIFSLMANMSFFSKELIWIWTGRLELAAKVEILLPIIGMSYAMLSLQIIPFNVAIANGYTRLNNILGIVSLLLTIPGYYFATKYYSAPGAAMVFCFVQTSTTIIYYYFINKKFIEIDLLTLYGKKLLFPLITTIIVAYGIHAIPFDIWGNRFVSLGWIGMSTLISLVVTTFLFIDRATLNLFWQALPFKKHQF